MHPACLVPPVTGSVSADWSCLLCEGKAEEYLRQKRKSIAQQLERCVYCINTEGIYPGLNLILFLSLLI